MFNESSISRIQKWVLSKDIVCISAFRYMLTNVTKNTLIDIEINSKYSKNQNLERNRKLKASLVTLGYGVTRLAGSFIENFSSKEEKEVQEESFFVVNVKNDPSFKEKIFKLSEYYNQDSFLFKERDKDEAVLVGTNLSDSPGYKKEDVQGAFHPKVTSQFMSRLRASGFSFANKEDLFPHKPFTFSDRKAQRVNKENFDEQFYDVLGLELFERKEVMGKLSVYSSCLEILKTLGLKKL